MPPGRLRHRRASWCSTRVSSRLARLDRDQLPGQRLGSNAATTVGKNALRDMIQGLGFTTIGGVPGVAARKHRG